MVFNLFLFARFCSLFSFCPTFFIHAVGSPCRFLGFGGQPRPSNLFFRICLGVFSLCMCLLCFTVFCFLISRLLQCYRVLLGQSDLVLLLRCYGGAIGSKGFGIMFSTPMNMSSELIKLGWSSSNFNFFCHESLNDWNWFNYSFIHLL